MNLKTDPVSLTDWLVDAAVILLAGLSGPFVVLLLPFFIVRALLRRSRSSWIVLLLVTAPTALQLWMFFRSAQPAPLEAPVRWLQLGGVFSLQATLSLFGAPWWSQSLAALGATALGLIVLGAIGWVSLAPRSKHLPAAIMMWAFAALLVVAAAKRIRFDHFGLHAFDASDRYFFIPKVLLLWLLIISMDRRTLRGRFAIGLLVVSVISTAPLFRFAPLKDLQWKKYCDSLRTGEPVKVPINPDWVVEFPRRKVP